MAQIRVNVNRTGTIPGAKEKLPAITHSWDHKGLVTDTSHHVIFADAPHNLRVVQLGHGHGPLGVTFSAAQPERESGKITNFDLSVRHEPLLGRNTSISMRIRPGGEPDVEMWRSGKPIKLTDKSAAAVKKSLIGAIEQEQKRLNGLKQTPTIQASEHLEQIKRLLAKHA